MTVRGMSLALRVGEGRRAHTSPEIEDSTESKGNHNSSDDFNPRAPCSKHLAGFTSSPSPNGEKKAATPVTALGFVLDLLRFNYVENA